MFKKPIKIKSNTQIKASERKTLRENLLKTFPALSENDLETILPKKETINNVKILTATGEVVQIYTVQKRPIIFNIEGKWYPAVYLLWKFPDLVPTYTTHSQVLPFITSGADLMLPGVVTPPTPLKYGNFSKNTVASVNLTTNKAPIAVGVTSQSSNEMTSGRGKCVNIYHFWGDKLCTLEGLNALPVPNLGPPDWLKMKSYDEDFPELGSQPKIEQNNDNNVKEEEEVNENEEIKNVETIEEENKEMTTEDMDELLNYCFMVAVKYSKTLQLPILTSNFYKLQILPQCPEGKTLDIKKTSYKKLKPFLDSMSALGIITIKEMKKGVETITAINREHPKYCEFYIEPALRPKKDEKDQPVTTNVTESYIITQNVLPLFNSNGYSKGDVIERGEIRRLVTEYVKSQNCQIEDDKRLIKPMAALKTICKTENPITWEELMEKVCDSMKSCFKVLTGRNDEIINKGKVTPITISVSVRSGNKKVTLVDNLEAFGININQFAKECQHGVAASTSINKPPGKKYDQLLVQGNQTLFVNNLLTDKYKIPQRYIKGLENAPKKKKS